jgi:D-apiose dehydrogenase
VYCLAQTINKEIKGEDVANVLMKMKSGLHCYVEMSYASLLEKEQFPQTLALVEGTEGSLQLTHDFVLKTTTKNGTTAETYNPKIYSWLDPAYAVVHSSIVDCNRNILQGLNGGKSETTGMDNFETVKLVWAAYEANKQNKVIQLNDFVKNVL